MSDHVKTTTPGEGDAAKTLNAKRIKMPGYQVEVGPIGHLHQERTALDALTFEHFSVKPTGVTLGAEVSGIDLTGELSADAIAEIRSALLAYKVLFFREQPVTPAQHVALARRFGELEIHPFIGANNDHPELVRFEKSADVGGYENGWHSDVSWRAAPSMGAILHAISVPEVGGDTLFCDMAAIYDGLDDALRNRIDDLWAIHDFAQAFGHSMTPEKRAEMRDEYPLARHPVIRTHPETGRRLVYVNRFFVDGIEGMDQDEAIALVDELCSFTNIPEYQTRLRWENDTVAFWDNRVVQHYASSDYWPHVRVMERASIVGDAPR